MPRQLVPHRADGWARVTHMMRGFLRPIRSTINDVSHSVRQSGSMDSPRKVMKMKVVMTPQAPERPLIMRVV